MSSFRALSDSLHLAASLFLSSSVNYFSIARIGISCLYKLRFINGFCEEEKMREKEEDRLMGMEVYDSSLRD